MRLFLPLGQISTKIDKRDNLWPHMLEKNMGEIKIFLIQYLKKALSELTQNKRHNYPLHLSAVLFFPDSIANI